MRISTRGRYGLRAMADIAANGGGGSVTLGSVAERQGISEHYLEQLAAALKKSGFIKSVRGSRGGYYLAMPPGEMSVGAILRALEGPLYPADCVSDETASCGGADCGGCVARPVWEKIYESFSGVVDNMTLEDMMNGGGNE